MDTLTAMKVFVTIHQKGSLTSAADYLDMSRAMVSRYLEHLEKHLKIRLFQRTTRQLHLTAAGEQALQQCQQMMALQTSLHEIADTEQHNLEGMLRITVSPVLLQGPLSRYIVAFGMQYPEVTIELIASEETLDLFSQPIDLALRISNDIAPGLIVKPLSQYHSTLCATPQYLAQHSLPTIPEELINHACLGHRHVGRDAWSLIMPDGSVKKVPIQVKFSTNDAVALYSLTMQHAGIAMLPCDLVQTSLQQGTLVQLLADYPPQPLGLQVVYASRQYIPHLHRTFIDYLTQCFESFEVF